MKLRIYFLENGEVDRIENDPAYRENGEYKDDFHPHVYLVDPNDASQGYKTPKWCVCDSADLPDCPIEWMRMEGDKCVVDESKKKQAYADNQEKHDHAAKVLAGIKDDGLRAMISDICKKLGMPTGENNG